MKFGSSDRRLWLAMAAAAALVLFRSFVFVWYEQNFDSDQAIVGLMAKHLSEFRAFPLFFYGQNYMLGVQAWIAVPFFWLGGPTVTMLKLPLALVNIAVVVLLIRLLTASGVPPWLSFVATLPLAACGTVANSQLLSSLGASVEPLLYVIVLWLLRKRPTPFGIVLCAGSLHREFTLYALPAIALLQFLDLRRIRWTAVFQSAAAFAVTWLAIDQLKRHVNIAGPWADPNVASGSLAQEAVHVGRLMSLKPSIYIDRIHLLLVQGLPDLLGSGPLPVSAEGIWGETIVGSRLAAEVLAIAVFVCAARALWIIVRTHPRGAQFQAFLFLVSLEALVAYGLHGGADVEARTELNYVLMVLLLPVAVFGAFFLLETRRAFRGAAVAAIAVWTVAMLADDARLMREYVVSPPESPHRVLADYLTEHRIKYAWARYWDSYRVTFLSRERVIVASTDIVRIPGYQSRVELNRANAARLVRQPCSEGVRVAEWCVVDPYQR